MKNNMGETVNQPTPVSIFPGDPGAKWMLFSSPTTSIVVPLLGAAAIVLLVIAFLKFTGRI